MLIVIIQNSSPSFLGHQDRALIKTNPRHKPNLMNLSYDTELPSAGSNLNHRLKLKITEILMGDSNLNRS